MQIYMIYKEEMSSSFHFRFSKGHMLRQQGLIKVEPSIQLCVCVMLDIFTGSKLKIKCRPQLSVKLAF
jgi:hypothetical protein